MIMSLW